MSMPTRPSSSSLSSAPAPAPATSSFFKNKKTQILTSLASSTSPNYTDKSPKGSIDADIIDLIDLINSFPGYVTTSSCAGRVAVFVEGRKTPLRQRDGDGKLSRGQSQDAYADVGADLKTETARAAGPGGKGAGNRWLYVSHSPVDLRSLTEAAGGGGGGGGGVGSGIGDDYYDDNDDDVKTRMVKQQPTTLHGLFGLTPQSTPECTSLRALNGARQEQDENSEEVEAEEQYPTASNVRLAKLSFSPLILHILCSSLQTAKPLLAAAISAGFRESGVQSLKALDDEEAGVMVAIRTAGLSFETVVGWVDERQRVRLEQQRENEDQEEEVVNRQEHGESEREEETKNEIYRSCVSEGVLRMFVNIANDRFSWNEQRRERLRKLLLSIGKETRNTNTEWEDKAKRRERKKEEGLRRQEKKEQKSNGHTGVEEDDTTEIIDHMSLFQEAT